MAQGFSYSGGSNAGGSGGSGVKGLSNRKYTVHLSLSGAITAGIFVLIGVGFIFAFGMMVGRGYNPEKKMPELARLLPAPATEPVAIDSKILKPEELNFMTELRQKPGAEPKQDAVQLKTPQGVLTTSVKASTPQAPQAAQLTSAAPQTVPKTPAPKVPLKTSQSDFVYQAVAYKLASQADALRERLEGEGMRTRMQSEKDNAGKIKWYRVQVLLRGTDEDAVALKAQLARFGIKDVTLASKKSVPTRNR